MSRRAVALQFAFTGTEKLKLTISAWQCPYNKASSIKIWLEWKMASTETPVNILEKTWNIDQTPDLLTGHLTSLICNGEVQQAHIGCVWSGVNKLVKEV